VTVTGLNVQYSNTLSGSTTAPFTGLPAGNYEYSVSYPFGTSVAPSSGYFTISKNTTIDLKVTVLKDYNVNFDSSGLASSESFSVSLSRSGYYVSNTSLPSLSYVGFSVPNGTYEYHIYNYPGELSPNPSSGTVYVNGGNVVINIQFTTSPRDYSVAFNILNLPPNIQNFVFMFNVDISSGYYYVTSGSSYSSTMTFNLPNGTYTFYDNLGLYLPPSVTGGLSPTSGVFIVQGKNVVVNLTLLPPESTYTVKLTETGLPSGQIFAASIGGFNNETVVSPTSNYLTYTLTNDSYYYSIGDISGFGESPSSGEVIVNGASVAMQIAFYRGFYVNFTASNLPSNIPNGGFGWEVKLINSVTGNSYKQNSNGPKISFSSMPAAIYTYTVATYGSYQILKSSGSVTVNTTNVNVMLNVSLVKLYAVTFTETGLLPGTAWGVIVDNGFVYSANNFARLHIHGGVTSPMTFTLYLANGTYSVQGYTIDSSTGFTAFNSPQSFTVSGKMSNNSVAFSDSVPSTTANSGVLTDTVLGVVGGLAVGIAAVTAFMYFRKRPPAVTPKSE
jgi:hypothetical protein